MQKTKKIALSLAVAFALGLGIVGCGGGGGGSSSTTDVTKTISGQAIDGYISGAKVCLDINKNNSCEDNEPSTTTDNNGDFSLSTNLSGEYPIVISGGTDMATGEAFNGTLKNVVKLNDISTKIDTKITPLTTLVANVMQDDSTISLNQAKQTIADNLGLTVSDIEKDPMKDQKIFAKTQQIINTVKVLSESIQKDESDIVKRKQAFDHIMKQVSLSIKEDTNSKDVNVSKIITQVENTTYDENAIIIPDGVETFTKDFSNEIKTKAGSTLDVNNLSDLQNGFNGYINKAKEKIKNSTISTLKDITEEVKATTTTILINKKEAFVIPEYIVVDKNKTKIFHKLSPLYFDERKAYFDDRQNALKGTNHLLTMASYGNAFLSGGTSEVAKETTKNLVYDSLDGLGVEGVTSEILLKLTDKFTGIITSKNPLASLKLETINSIVDMGAVLGGELSKAKLTEQINSGTMAQYLLTLYYEHNENWKDVNYFLNIQQDNLTQDTFDAVNEKYKLNMNGMNLGASGIVIFDNWVVQYDPDSVIKIINKVGSIVNTVYDNLPDNKNPIAIIEQDSINTEGYKIGDTVDFTASKSSDSDGTILHYYWYLDSPNSSTTKFLTNCEDNQYCSVTFDKSGEYSIKLQVEDDDSAKSDIDSVNFQIISESDSTNTSANAKLMKISWFLNGNKKEIIPQGYSGKVLRLFTWWGDHSIKLDINNNSNFEYNYNENYPSQDVWTNDDVKLSFNNGFSIQDYELWNSYWVDDTHGEIKCWADNCSHNPYGAGALMILDDNKFSCDNNIWSYDGSPVNGEELYCREFEIKDETKEYFKSFINNNSTNALTYSWNTSSWGNCTGSCGTNNGVKIRTATCKDSKGNSVSDSMCTDTKPNLTQSCTASQCDNSVISHNWLLDEDKQMNWNEAKTYCNNKGGRLPTYQELNYEFRNNKIQNINTDNFNLVYGFENWTYWSSTKDANYPVAGGVNFNAYDSNGDVETISYDVSWSASVRCIKE